MYSNRPFADEPLSIHLVLLVRSNLDRLMDLTVSGRIVH